MNLFLSQQRRSYSQYRRNLISLLSGFVGCQCFFLRRFRARLYTARPPPSRRSDSPSVRLSVTRIVDPLCLGNAVFDPSIIGHMGHG